MKCLYDHQLSNQAYFSDITAILQWKTFIRVLPTRWRRKPDGGEITSQSPYVFGNIRIFLQHSVVWLEGSSRVKNQLDSFIRFRRTPTCDRQTDRQTDTSTASRGYKNSHCRRSSTCQRRRRPLKWQKSPHVIIYSSSSGCSSRRPICRLLLLQQLLRWPIYSNRYLSLLRTSPDGSVHFCARIYIGWQWRDFDASWLSSPSCGWNSDKCFSLWYRRNTLCRQASDHAGIFVNQRIECYLKSMINLRPLTPHIMPCYSHKMTIVSWP